MQTEVDDAKEQAMLDASRALATLTDLMVRALPAHAQQKIADLLSTGAKLIVNVVMIPFPSFTLVLLPADPEKPGLELVGCSPSADTVRALGSSNEVAH